MFGFLFTYIVIWHQSFEGRRGRRIGSLDTVTFFSTYGKFGL